MKNKIFYHILFSFFPFFFAEEWEDGKDDGEASSYSSVDEIYPELSFSGAHIEPSNEFLIIKMDMMSVIPENTLPKMNDNGKRGKQKELTIKLSLEEVSCHIVLKENSYTVRSTCNYYHIPEETIKKVKKKRVIVKVESIESIALNGCQVSAVDNFLIVKVPYFTINPTKEYLEKAIENGIIRRDIKVVSVKKQ